MRANVARDMLLSFVSSSTADFAAHDPFFRIIEQGLDGLAGPGHFSGILAVDITVEYVVTVPGYHPRSAAEHQRLNHTATDGQNALTNALRRPERKRKIRRSASEMWNVRIYPPSSAGARCAMLGGGGIGEQEASAVTGGGGIREQAVALHPGGRLRGGRDAVPKSPGDPRAQRDEPFLRTSRKAKDAAAEKQSCVSDTVTGHVRRT
jgi:hypothetical protein